MPKFSAAARRRSSSARGAGMKLGIAKAGVQNRARMPGFKIETPVRSAPAGTRVRRPTQLRPKG